MTKKTIFLAMAMIALITLSACGSYYMVKDVTTDKVFYTKDLKRNDGTVILKDANTGDTVTLQNSEVTEINRETFKAKTKMQ